MDLIGTICSSVVETLSLIFNTGTVLCNFLFKTSVSEQGLDPPELYHFDPIRTGTVLAPLL
jgi:hypothetical protein